MEGHRKIAGRRPPGTTDAGALCLDFVNTLDDRFSDEPKELLASYIDLARFGEDAGILESRQVERLFPMSLQYPEKAKRALNRYRSNAQRNVHAVSGRCSEVGATAALLSLNGDVQEAAQHAQQRRARRSALALQSTPSDFLRRWAINALSTPDLLVSISARHVQPPAFEGVQWLFLDMAGITVTLVRRDRSQQPRIPQTLRRQRRNSPPESRWQTRSAGRHDLNHCSDHIRSCVGKEFDELRSTRLTGRLSPLVENVANIWRTGDSGAYPHSINYQR